MLDTLITSKTRIKLLLKFFLNSNNQAYLRGLEKEFEESSNSIRTELNRFIDAGMLHSESNGNKRIYRANTNHPLFVDLQNIIKKFMGIDQLIERVIDRLGNVDEVYLEGKIARGVSSDIIDVTLIGDNINSEYLLHLVSRAEPIIGKRIRTLVFTNQEGTNYIAQNKSKLFLIWPL